MKILIFASLFFVSIYSWGHGGEDHSMDKPKVKKASPDEELKQKYYKINEQYIKSVKPVFKNSCFDCHGDKTNYPWYYKLPGVKQLIDHDVKEAKKHLDFSKDFPFVSHDTPVKDLDAIGKAVRNATMPPFRYRILHGDSELTEDEVKEVEKWIKESKETLK
ncbi:MAG: mono/diheme cytochrome c family protein [Bacteriovoracaceae bacterium]